MVNDRTSKAPLLATHNNPPPGGAVSGYLELPDSIRLRYARWEAPSGSSRGTILLQHGRTECIEKYYETVREFRKLGFGVVTFDWRGQGGSSRLLSDPLRGHIESFDHYLDDLEAILAQVVLPDCRPPFHLVGHSTGGLIALLAAPALGNRINRLVVNAPFLELREIPLKQSRMKHVLGLLTYIGFGRSYVPGTSGNIDKTTFEGNKLTSDRRRFERRVDIMTNHREIALSGPTISWLYSAFTASEHISQPGFADSISIPTLFILAGNDTVVSTSYAERYASSMRAASFLTIAGARHEILQEADVYREQALAAIDAFLPRGDEDG